MARRGLPRVDYAGLAKGATVRTGRRAVTSRAAPGPGNSHEIKRVWDFDFQHGTARVEWKYPDEGEDPVPTLNWSAVTTLSLYEGFERSEVCCS